MGGTIGSWAWTSAQANAGEGEHAEDADDHALAH